ncbi:hypothetical protein CS8_031680 [Cupriavidus sp. 8B]
MQGVGEQAGLRVVEREAGFVAGGFDAEDKHGRGKAGIKRGRQIKGLVRAADHRACSLA